jgi:hypothetical protein
MRYTKDVCRPLAQKVTQAVIQGEQIMPPDKPRTARQICGKRFWNGLTVAERRFAGRFISAAVRLGLFGLKRSHRDGSNHWRYRI